MSANEFEAAYPGSRKVYLSAQAGEVTFAVPMREIHLSGGEPPLRCTTRAGRRV